MNAQRVGTGVETGILQLFTLYHFVGRQCVYVESTRTPQGRLFETTARKIVFQVQQFKFKFSFRHIISYRTFLFFILTKIKYSWN